MEDISGFDAVELPAGFRFHPTDEELISHYLYMKVMSGSSFSCKAIGEVDLNKSEPWELPRLAKTGEKEWYFFCTRDRKYPTGSRTNRATESGYWKATGKDKEIYREKSLVGMKKILVFYTGRAPRGEKSNWVMHEFRLEGRFSPSNLPITAKNEWVISRVFRKRSCSSWKSSCGNEFDSSASPAPAREESSYVTCFSMPANLQLPSYAPMADDSVLREMISVSRETGITCDMNNEISSFVSDSEMGQIQFEDQEPPPGYFWNY